MEKLGLIFRETSQMHIKDRLKESSAVFIVKYSGISSPDLSTLRQYLRKSHADFFVIKNSVARRALKDSGGGSLLDLIDGPCGLVFVKDEPVSASRDLFNFTKVHEQLKLEGGLLKDKLLKGKDIEIMAKLPNKEVLRIQLLLALNAPLVRLAMVLKGNLRKLLFCLEQVRQKKDIK